LAHSGSHTFLVPPVIMYGLHPGAQSICSVHVCEALRDDLQGIIFTYEPRSKSALYVVAVYGTIDSGLQ
jgi:hypothetical protein